MYRSLFLILIAAIMCAGQVATQGLVAWYPFTNGVNNEAPGSALQLTYNPDATWAPTVAKAKALSRTGDSCAFKLTAINGLYGSDSPLPKGNSARTVSLWVWFDVMSGTPTNVISYGSNASGKLFQIRIISNPSTRCVLSNGTDSLLVWSAVTNRVWTNLTVVIKGDTTYGYMNGSLVAYKVITTWDTENLLATSVIIGGKGSTYQTYKGSLDDIAIYNRALTSPQVQALYIASPYLTGTVPTVAHLTQVTQRATRPYSVLLNGQVVRQQPSNLRRLFNLFK
jgi:hypothetical protein